MNLIVYNIFYFKQFAAKVAAEERQLHNVHDGEDSEDEEERVVVKIFLSLNY